MAGSFGRRGQAWCVAAGLAVLSLTGCATGSRSDASVKHLYASEAATVRSIELLVTADDVVPRATNSSRGAEVQQQFLPGVNPMIPATPSGALGAAIALALIEGMVASERAERDSLRVGRAAERVAEQVRVLRPQLAGLDLASEIKSDLEQYLTRAHRAGLFPFELRSAAAGTPPPADAVLSVAVQHAFYDWGLPRRAGVPLLPPGLLLYVRAAVTLVRADGTLLMQDAIIFETPHSENPDEEARIAWWAEKQRYRTSLMLIGRALGAALAGEVLGTRLYANESEYAAQRKLDNAKSIAEREDSLERSLARFRRCHGLEGRPGADADFQTLRQQADGDVYVGLRCDAQDRNE